MMLRGVRSSVDRGREATQARLVEAMGSLRRRCADALELWLIRFRGSVFAARVRDQWEQLSERAGWARIRIGDRAARAFDRLSCRVSAAFGPVVHPIVAGSARFLSYLNRSAPAPTRRARAGRSRGGALLRFLTSDPVTAWNSVRIKSAELPVALFCSLRRDSTRAARVVGAALFAAGALLLCIMLITAKKEATPDPLEADIARLLRPAP